MSPSFAYLCLGLSVIWCFLHFLIYILLVRNRPALYGERKILLYHCGSAFACSFVALALLIAFRCEQRSAMIAAGITAIHGIYSISFLELWSLAQGSYSIRILMGVQGSSGIGRHELHRCFFAIGEAKRTNRISSLSRAGLIVSDGEFWKLTLLGCLAVAGLRVLRFVPRQIDSG